MSRDLKLLCFDLDGTVYRRRPFRYMPPATARDLKRTHDAGVTTCAVTGRNVAMLGQVLTRAYWLDWAVCANGSYVYRMPGTSLISFRAIPADLADEAFNSVADLEPNWMCLGRHVACIEGGMSSYMFGRAASFSLFRVMSRAINVSTGHMAVVPSVQRRLREQSEVVGKLGCYGNTPDESQEIERRLVALGGLEVVRMGPRELEITAAGVTKGTGIDVLRELAGLPFEGSVMFGDSGNDLPALGHTERFVAVGNATDVVKAAADEVCDTVNRNGVGQWLQAQLGL